MSSPFKYAELKCHILGRQIEFHFPSFFATEILLTETQRPHEARKEALARKRKRLRQQQQLLQQQQQHQDEVRINFVVKMYFKVYR